jgi:pimeloyl-ACP methyl ester carboxylesterase
MRTVSSIDPLVLPEITHRVPSTDGVTLGVYDWGGDGPPLLFCHATGMHAHTYIPLAARLRDRFHCYGLDARSQGMSTTPRTGQHTWDGIADDAAAALDFLKLSGRGDVHAIGHSQGGFTMMSGEHRRPGTFAAMFGFEPVVIPQRPGGEPADPNQPSLVNSALKRRAVFPSREAAYENYKAKPPFSGIDDDALRCYVYWGFEDRLDGTVTLRCKPGNEADLFRGSLIGSNLWDSLGSIQCPVTVAVSEFTGAVFAENVPKQAERLARGTLLRCPGRTHFGLLERIDEMVELILSSFASAHS